jgi:hypothetical protein
MGVLSFSLVDRIVQDALYQNDHFGPLICLHLQLGQHCTDSTYDLLAGGLDSAVRPRANRRSKVTVGFKFLLNSSHHLVLEVAASV